MRFDFRFVSSQANFIYSCYTHNYTYIKLKNTHGMIFIILGSSGDIILNSSVNHSIVQEMVGRVISNAGEKAGGGLLLRPAISQKSYGAEETYS